MTCNNDSNYKSKTYPLSVTLKVTVIIECDKFPDEHRNLYSWEELKLGPKWNLNVFSSFGFTLLVLLPLLMMSSFKYKSNLPLKSLKCHFLRSRELRNLSSSKLYQSDGNSDVLVVIKSGFCCTIHFWTSGLVFCQEIKDVLI